MLQFDAATHTYTDDGRRLESVTEILEDVGLMEMPGASPSILEAARRRGTIVHEAIAIDMENDLDESSVPPEFMGYVLAARHWRNEKRFEWMAHEERVSHQQFKYAGTLDLRGTATIDGVKSKVICDWKTGQASPWVKYQLAAYAACFPSPAAFKRVCVELHENGTYSQFPFAPETFRQDFDVFLSALTICRIKRNGEKLK